MFKNAARKIAHNTTVPGLAGKQDLRALQDLITAEKAVLNSLQKLSVDFARASDALRMWGQGEGDDLGDTLIASNALLLHFASALSALANHEGVIREQMKAVRTREENLDELKRRRKSLISDADGAERKLSKMSPENKNLQQQTDLLNRLRDEIRGMDAEIMAEEASLGDFKRSSVRAWMGRKFGALLEACEKGAVVGELGKLVIAEIPLDQTQPGMPRAYYSGHARTEFLVAEAARSVAEISYSPDPDPNPSHRTIRQLPGPELPAVPSTSQQRRMSMGSANGVPYGQQSSQLGPSSPGPSYPGLPQVEASGFTVSPFMSPEQPSQSSMNPSVNEFGSFSNPPSTQPSSFSVAERDKPASPRGGRFATFPVKALGPRPPPGSNQPSNFAANPTNPYINAPPMQEGDRAPSIEIDRGNNNDDSFSASIAQALGEYTFEGSSTGAVGASSSRPQQDVKNGDFGPQRYSPPPPVYSPSDGQGLPMGAAPSNPPWAMQNGLGVLDMGNDKATSRPQSPHEEDDDGLAYMSPSHLNDSRESLPHASGDRRVRFGGVSDMEKELERRHEEQEHAAAAAAAAPAAPPPPPTSTHVSPTRVPVPPLLEEDIKEPETGRASPEVQCSQPASPQSDSDMRGRSPPAMARAPTPPATQLLDEKSLNAAAAREVSRELDALMMSSPPQSPTQTQPPPSPLSNRPQYSIPPYQRRAVSPLPSLSTAPAPGSQPTSPRLEGMYVRERDRSGSFPATRAPTLDTIPVPASPAASDGSDQQRPSINLPKPSSPALSSDTNGTPFRTPMSTPSGPPQSGSFYNLPSTTGSNASFNSAGGPRTISAAAFRRPQPQARNMSVDSVGSGVADTTPLNVKKRGALPASPYPSQNLQPGQGLGQGPRSASNPYLQQGYGEQDRPVSHYRQDGEDDFDYISAYTDDNADRASGYGSGRFATSLDNGNGIR
ncbi:hypothetical protein C8Q76DRAFT_797541 [Earliella scabrosa]|nr:hypothetical protein C8Q76DRAFT_797541 [Earliella scabrosa]